MQIKAQHALMLFNKTRRFDFFCTFCAVEVTQFTVLKGVHTMKCNVGTIDRTLRIVAGLILIGLAATGTVGVWGWIGVLPLLTGIFRFCPAYPLLGVNSCGKDANKG